MFYSFLNGIKTIGQFLQSPLLLIIRLYWGYQLAIAGLGKFLNLEDISSYFESLGIPFSHFNAIAVGSVEMIGGILIFLGLFARIVSIPLIINFVVAYLTAGRETIELLLTKLNPDAFFNDSAFLFLYAVLIVFCFGPGKISLDYWLSGDYKIKQMP